MFDRPHAYEDGDEEEAGSPASSPSSDQEDPEWTPGEDTKPSNSRRGVAPTGRHPSRGRARSSSSTSSLRPHAHSTTHQSNPTSSQPHRPSSVGGDSQSKSSGHSVSPSASTRSSHHHADKPYNPSTSRKKLRVGPRPRRFQSNARQVELFLESFERAERPSAEERNRLAIEATKLADPGLSVTSRNVNVWFQNRRQGIREQARGIRPAQRKRARSPGSDAVGQASVPTTAFGDGQQLDHLRAHVLYESSPIVLIPATSLVLGSWVRNLTSRLTNHPSGSSSAPDLVAYANPTGRYFGWYISHAGRGYRMLVPFSNVVGLSTTSTECVFSVSSPPLMWCTRMRDGTVDLDALDGPWEAIGDFTEGVASAAREHVVKGDSTTRSTILNIVTSSSELSHLISPPSTYLQLPRRSSKTSSHSSSPSSSPNPSVARRSPGFGRVSPAAPSSSLGRLSLDPFSQAANTQVTPFTFQQRPPARPYSSAGERSTLAHDSRTMSGGSAPDMTRPWTTGDWDQPRMTIEHASAPAPSAAAYLPAQLGPPALPRLPRQRHESAGAYAGAHPSSQYEYPRPASLPRATGSSQFRYEQATGQMEMDIHPGYAPQEAVYEDPSAPVHQPHQRYMSAPVPASRTQVQARPSSSSFSSARRPLSGYYTAPVAQAGYAHPHPSPTSSATSWQNRSAASSWQYTSDSAPSSASASHPRVSSGSSGFDYLPDLGPGESPYAAQPIQQYQHQTQSQQQYHDVQYGLSPPPTADKPAYAPYIADHEAGVAWGTEVPHPELPDHHHHGYHPYH